MAALRHDDLLALAEANPEKAREIFGGREASIDSICNDLLRVFELSSEPTLDIVTTGLDPVVHAAMRLTVTLNCHAARPHGLPGQARQ
jgi:hypothetical protein